MDDCCRRKHFWPLQLVIILLCCSVCRCSSSVSSLQRWLRKHGHQLRKLRMHSIMQRGLSKLPCPQLQHLALHSCVFDFRDGGSAFCSSIRTATGLTSLHFSKCKLFFQGKTPGDFRAAATQLLSALAPLTALQELSVCGAGMCTNISMVLAGYVLLPATVLQPLQHLTQLHLNATGRSDGLVQHIGSMADLQDLRLGGVKGDPLLLPVTQLTALTKLRRLGLRGVSLNFSTAEVSGANAAALLAWLPALQGLSSLQLRVVTGLCAGRDDQPAVAAANYPPATAYRALTAGSRLQQIDLRGTDVDMWASRCAFQYVDNLTSITSLRLGSQVPYAEGSNYFIFECVVSNCPNLQRLQGYWPSQTLQQITGLTSLTVPLLSWGDSRFGWLTRLKSLRLQAGRSHEAHEMVVALLGLTPLTQLSFLGLSGNFGDPRDAAIWDSVAGAAWQGVEAAGCDYAFVNKVRNRS
jgi:hypothetical protein